MREQLRHVPADATHLIVSAGGNDALGSSDFLGAPARSTAEALTRLADIADGFESRYYGMLAGVLAHGLPWAIRTVYYPRFPDAALQKIAVTGLAVFNDCIVRAADRPPPTESLKPTVAEAGRFHPENRGCLPYRCSYLPAALGLVGSSGSALALVDAEVNALNGNDPCIQANGVAVNGDGTDNGCDQSNGSDGGYKDGGYDRGDYRHQ